VPEREYGQLRVLVANQLPVRAEAVSKIARSLGHEVVALELDVDKIAQVTRREHPDVALVGLGESSTHALEQIVHDAACPVILVLDAKDPERTNSNRHSTSSCAASPSSTTSRAPSAGGRSSSEQRAS
jgi:AmiR/NasT family two-component response regulator